MHHSCNVSCSMNYLNLKLDSKSRLFITSFLVITVCRYESPLSFLANYNRLWVIKIRLERDMFQFRDCFKSLAALSLSLH